MNPKAVHNQSSKYKRIHSIILSKKLSELISISNSSELTVELLAPPIYRILQIKAKCLH